MSIEWNRTESSGQSKPASWVGGDAASAPRRWLMRLRFGTEIAIMLVLCLGWLGYSFFVTKVPERVSLPAVTTSAAPSAETLARDKLAEALLAAERHPDLSRERHFPVDATWPAPLTAASDIVVKSDAPAPTDGARQDASQSSPAAPVSVAVATITSDAAPESSPVTTSSIAPVAPRVPETTPIATPKPDTAADAPQLMIDPAERKVILDRATTMLRTGDIAGARVTLGRLVRAGDASGLLLMGRTYDPQVLHSLGVLGIKGDQQRADDLYRQAGQGSSLDSELALKSTPK